MRMVLKTLCGCEQERELEYHYPPPETIKLLMLRPLRGDVTGSFAHPVTEAAERIFELDPKYHYNRGTMDFHYIERWEDKK